MKTNRRNFIVGCSSAIAAMAGSSLSQVAFGNPDQVDNQDTLLVIFLRGGIDGLSAIPVIDGPDRAYYETSREDIAIPTSGDNAAIPLNDNFGLHPAAAPLLELYQDRKLAIIQAVGLRYNTRSHFDAMKMIELGSPGLKGGHTGWLTRHLRTMSTLADDTILPALAVGNLQPTAFAGSDKAVGISSPSDFGFRGHWRYEDLQRSALRKMYAGASWMHAAGRQTLDALDTIELGNPGSYEPANGATYPSGSFGENLKSVAQMIKMSLGLTVATVDYGGWDTHEYQGDDGGGYFASRLETVALGLNALYTDLNQSPTGSNGGQHVTTLVMSEFGRSLKQNGSRGTDHGHGSFMMLLGEHVNGGQIYGEWPGLHTDQLYDRRDLAITTDYRQVLSEVLIKRFSNPKLGTIFPGYTDHESLNTVQGAELTPDYEPDDATPGTPPHEPGNRSQDPSIFLPMIAS